MQKDTAQDTVNLLRECDAGVQMGISALDEVLDRVKCREFHALLAGYRREYAVLQDEMRTLLAEHGNDGKEPGPIARSMAWMKTNWKLGIHGNDATVADLITEGCNSGNKCLNRYLNEYQAADEPSRAFARKLIELGDRQALEIRPYL